MSRICEVCGKKYNKATVYSWLRASNRNPTTSVRQQPNLKVIKVGGKTKKVCMKCYKASFKIKKKKTV